jgi:hypothetical protein
MKEELIVALSADIKDLKANLEKANNSIKGFSDNAGSNVKRTSNEFSQLGSAASKLGGMVAGAFAVGGMISFGKSVIDTTAQFQKFEAVLSNTLGSNSAAQMAMDSIVEFASKTPFQVDELTGAFVKLANQGFKPTMAEMKSLGDLAASTGKSFDQLAEGILDAQTGEYERLKEFGIKAKDMGDKVQFTFKGVKTEVEKSSEAIKGYIVSLGNANGVTGAMDKISKTLGGQISNLSDNWTTLMKNLGDSNTGVMSKTVDYLNQMLGAINKIGKADNLASKLGIDQRGKSWTEVPFSEMINLIGGVTVGQAENLKLAETYDTLGKKIQGASTSVVALQNLILQFKQQKNGLSKDNPEWNIYVQRIKDAGEALNALNIERQKAKDATSTPKIDLNTLGGLEAQLKVLQEKLKATNKNSPFFTTINDQITELENRIEKINFKTLKQKLGDTPKFNIDNIDPNANVDLSSLAPTVKEVNDLQAGLNLVFDQSKELEVIGGVIFTPMQDGIKQTLVQTSELATELNNLAINTAEMFASGLGDAFAQSIIEGENFRQSMENVFKDLGKMIIAQIVKMLALKALMALIGGPVGIAGSAAISGANVGSGGGLGQLFNNFFGGRIATGVNNGINSGSVAFEIRGDKLYGVLHNYQGRLDRLV